MKDNGYNKGGLKTSETKVDPVSGNEVPVGSEPEEVRDNINANLSEGEYVVPADVVKFFGVDYFEKLRMKAKKGLEEMDKDGRIGGEPASQNYNQGGMVAPNLSAMIDNAKLHAAKNPEFAQMLASKGIKIEQDQGGQPVEGNMGAPIQMNEGGMVPEWEKIFAGQAPSPQSDFDPSQYQLGFYGAGNTGTNPNASRCGPGTVWDEASQMCVPEPSVSPVSAAEIQPADNGQTSSGGGGGGNAPAPGQWMEKYDYTDPQTLVDQTMTTLGAGPDEELSQGEKLLGNVGGFLGDALSGGLVGGAFGKMIKGQRYAEAMANAEVLRAQGLIEEADAVASAATSYAEKNGVRPGGFFDSSKRLTDDALTKMGKTSSDKQKPTPKPTPVRDSNDDDDNRPNTPTKTTRPSATAQVEKAPVAGASNKYVGRTDSTGKKAGDAGYKSALVERKTKEKVSKGQEAGKGYRGGYGFAKGGLVKPRKQQ